MAIRAVVFDLFDTLVDLRGEDLPLMEHRGERIPASVKKLHAMVSTQADVDLDDFIDAFEAGARAFAESHLSQGREVTTFDRFTDLLARIGLVDADLAERVTQVHMGVLRSAVRVPEHHASVLDALKARVDIGLCSNFSHSETALGILDESGFAPRLDAIVVSDAFGLRKPRAEIFDEVLYRLGVGRDEVIHVGDSLRADVGGAGPLGIRTVWITRRVRDPESRLREHTGHRPDHAIADLAELPAILDRLGA